MINNYDIEREYLFDDILSKENNLCVNDMLITNNMNNLLLTSNIEINEPKRQSKPSNEHEYGSDKKISRTET